MISKKVSLMFFIWLLFICNALLFLIILGIVVWFSCLIVTIQGNSMSPTFNNGDRVLVLNWAPRSWIRRGRIIFFRSFYDIATPTLLKEKPNAEELHIKRIVAVAGDKVVTSINEIQESSRSRLKRYHNEQGLRIWNIPENHVFVRGDNHSASVDSLHHGPLPLQSIYGIVLMKVPKIFYR